MYSRAKARGGVKPSLIHREGETYGNKGKGSKLLVGHGEKTAFTKPGIAVRARDGAIPEGERRKVEV